MSMERLLVVLIVCVFFVGACATKGKKAPAPGAEAGAVIGAGSVSVKEGSTVISPGGTTINRLEQELKLALSGSEITSFKRQKGSLVLIFRSDSLFGFDSTAIKAGARTEIRRVAEVLDRYQGTRIRIEGHTDSIGVAESNQKLSERRADAVRKELIAQSMQSDRIEIVGFGAARPVASNKTPDGRRQNRRVQIIIIPARERL